MPSAELLAEVDGRKDELIALLSQPVPKKLAYWFYHPLYLDYEARPVAVMAAKLGVAIYLRPCSLGIWLEVMEGVAVDSRPFSLPTLSPILQNAGYSYHREAYLID
ncbi:hypothetical protein BH10CHL1_BH10CHL1_24300 [soil metagenome]